MSRRDHGSRRERQLEQRRAIIEAHIDLALAGVVAKLESGWIDQRHSPLGRQRHIDAVRERRQRGLPDAAKVGRRYLLTIDAMVDEYFEPASREVRALRALSALGRRAADNDNARSGGRRGW